MIIDNNSTDASAEVIKRYPRVKLVYEIKPGASAARNRGQREAKYGVIAFTDPDCAHSSDSLQETEEAMVHSEGGLVIGSHQSARNSFLLTMLVDYENEKSNYVFNSE